MLPVIINNKKLKADKVVKKAVKKETAKIKTLIPKKKKKEEEWDIWDIMAFGEWEESELND